jgi:hypothetical protein
MKRLLTLCALLPIVAGCATPSQMAVDAEVKRLCAIDGGIKVYETVKLPPDRFDQWGNVRIPFKQSAKPSDDYYVESESIVLKDGDPKLIRMISRVVRRMDGKVLGESIHYGRGGGDLPGPWHPSSFTCPSPTEKPYLEPSIFLKGEF